MKPILIFVAQVLLAGSVAACLVPFITSWLEKRRYRLRWKQDVLVRLLGNLHFLTPGWIGRSSGEPYIALNEAYVAFDDSPPVIAALNKFREDLNDNNHNHLVTVIKAMAKPSGVRFDGLNDVFITHPFGPPNPEG